MPLSEKVAKTVSHNNTGKNIYIKAKFESPKHLHQTTFETFFETDY
jgi:hypothetical protein